MLVIPFVWIVGSILGTWGLWRLASAVRRAPDETERGSAWAHFWLGVFFAVVLLAVVFYAGDPQLGAGALVSSALTHAPWVGFLVWRARRPRPAEE